VSNGDFVGVKTRVAAGNNPSANLKMYRYTLYARIASRAQIHVPDEDPHNAEFQTDIAWLERKDFEEGGFVARVEIASNGYRYD
jgi:hypothetical protein